MSTKEEIPKLTGEDISSTDICYIIFGFYHIEDADFGVANLYGSMGKLFREKIRAHRNFLRHGEYMRACRCTKYTKEKKERNKYLIIIFQITNTSPRLRSTIC